MFVHISLKSPDSSWQEVLKGAHEEISKENTLEFKAIWTDIATKLFTNPFLCNPRRICSINYICRGKKKKKKVNPRPDTLYELPASAAVCFKCMSNCSPGHSTSQVVPASQKPAKRKHTEATLEFSFYRHLRISNYSSITIKSQYFLQFEIVFLTSRLLALQLTDLSLRLTLVFRHSELQLCLLKYMLTTLSSI